MLHHLAIASALAVIISFAGVVSGESPVKVLSPDATYSVDTGILSIAKLGVSIRFPGEPAHNVLVTNIDDLEIRIDSYAFESDKGVHALSVTSYKPEVLEHFKLELPQDRLELLKKAADAKRDGNPGSKELSREYVGKNSESEIKQLIWYPALVDDPKPYPEALSMSRIRLVENTAVVALVDFGRTYVEPREQEAMTEIEAFINSLEFR